MKNSLFATRTMKCKHVGPYVYLRQQAERGMSPSTGASNEM
jgi:hypothetical protein